VKARVGVLRVRYEAVASTGDRLAASAMEAADVVTELMGSARPDFMRLGASVEFLYKAEVKRAAEVESARRPGPKPRRREPRLTTSTSLSNFAFPGAFPDAAIFRRCSMSDSLCLLAGDVFEPTRSSAMG